MQLDYSDMKPAMVGGLGDTEFHDIVGRFSDEDIPFGKGLMIAATGKVALPVHVDEKFAGVAVQKNVPTPNDTGVAVYPAGTEISVIQQGRVWVNSETAVDPTEGVYLRCTDNYDGGVAGDFRSDSDASSSPVMLQITNARWAAKTTAKGLALLELNNP